MTRAAWIFGITVGALVLADSDFGPVVAALLGAAIVYRALQIQASPPATT